MGRLRRNRILGVAGATLAAAAVWAIEVPLLGLRLQTQFGNTAPQDVGIGLVVVSALGGSLAGWGLLALLERRYARARTIWTWIALAFLLVSFSAPLSAGTTTTTKFALAMMHLAVAAVLIPTLRRVNHRDPATTAHPIARKAESELKSPKEGNHGIIDHRRF
jgi:hypothetical protein